MSANASAILTLTCICLLTPATFAQHEVPTRDQIPQKYKWNLASIYPTHAAWEKDYERAERMLDRLTDLKDQTVDSPDALLNILTLRDEARWLTDKLLVYAHQLSDQDTRDNQALGMKDRALSLYTRYGQAASWIEPTLHTIPTDHLQAWWQTHPDLEVYEHYLRNVIRQKPHTLSPREEELLAMAGNFAMSPEQTYNVLKNAEMKWQTIEDEDGNEVTLSPARFNKFIRSQNRRVRRDAFTSTMATLGQFQNTFASTLSGQVQVNNFYAKARGFDTAIEATIYPDNLPIAVYHNLVDTINKHLPLLHRWASIRKRELNLADLHVYDLYQPLAAGADEEIPYDQAVNMVIAALQPLGHEYCHPMETGFNSRWIDVYETRGKRPGGYSWGSYDTQPFILMNYNGTLLEVSTLAHEMGHSMHSYMTHKHQPPIYGEYSMFVAEVAAIFNEILLEDYLRQQADTPEKKLRLLNEQIDGLRGTVFRQIMFSEFEYQAHKLAQAGEPLTADRLGQLYMDIFHKYWGPELVRDPAHAPYWARIPHFYMNHYVYRYASSYCAAVALAERVLNKEPGALEAYLGFLQAGSSDYPLEILKHAGVDMTTPDPIEATMRRFSRMLDDFESLQKQYARTN